MYSHLALVADKPIPTMEDQTVIQALLKKKITLEDSADKANLVLGDTKSNHNSVDSAATGNSNSESKKGSFLKIIRTITLILTALSYGRFPSKNEFRRH